MGPTQNVLHFEFFQVSGEPGQPLIALLDDCYARIADNLPLAMAGSDNGSGIKTVVRIYDTEETVTRLTREIVALKVRLEHHNNAPRTNMFTDSYAQLQIMLIGKKITMRMRRIIDYYTTQINRARHGSCAVARETWQHTFRPAEANELHDLLRATITMKSFWLFIFEPNDLLADINFEIAYIM